MSSELLSHRLVRFREQHGLSQVELATILGVTPRYLGYLEAGTKEIGPETSLYKLFCAHEHGLLSLDRQLGGERRSRDDNAGYKVSRSDSVGTNHSHGLTVQDALAQVRSDLAMLEGGAHADKRRAYYFLREMHLPMLAKMLKLE